MLYSSPPNTKYLIISSIFTEKSDVIARVPKGLVLSNIVSFGNQVSLLHLYVLYLKTTDVSISISEINKES